ncbi:uncharacterized protein BDR25DRAFT_378801 [Lindgomyces ingoldianus]|uniref:Uncharacterized protein n=1 Tax=Lindgomyces ingoldianus TaxID=673940 RepID=A0ACB6QFG6_9PLEO|nr:uncharacterized protein BDR25DRAFT_378801 [Lindgomyces ingoldianus]KAF2465615.1 hypothetical protein BDR25DRAFT_378801 [Lindgomyces ingoldianus]
MASYFDPQSSSKLAAEVVVKSPVQVDGLSPEDADTDAENRNKFLTPQVSRILENLDERSSSDGELSASHDSESSQEERIKKEGENNTEGSSSLRIQLSAIPENIPTKGLVQPPRSPGAGLHSRREKHPHLARFHSLRSMLFASRIEDAHAQCKEAKAKEEAEAKWKAEYQQRKAFNRPRTPGSPNKSPTHDGFSHKLGNKLRRMTSKEGFPSKDTKGEESTASSDVSDECDIPYEFPRTEKDGTAPQVESLGNSDVEDLVRWVSRRDPPSDGEVRENVKAARDIDSGRESLGHSDIEELVRWVSRKDEADVESTLDNIGEDASTGSESEGNSPGQDSLAHADIDGLVQWVSRKEGPNVGPVWKKKPSHILGDLGSEIESSDELVRWATHKDDTSGKSAHSDASGISTISDLGDEFAKGRGSLAQRDVDDLVRWIRRKDGKKSDLKGGDDKMPSGGDEEGGGMRTDQGILAPGDGGEHIR